VYGRVLFLRKKEAVGYEVLVDWLVISEGGPVKHCMMFEASNIHCCTEKTAKPLQLNDDLSDTVKFIREEVYFVWKWSKVA
jgi:hypothetical protein